MVKKHYSKIERFTGAMISEQRNHKSELAFQERQKKYREEKENEK